MFRKMMIGAVALVALVASPAAAQYTDFTVTPGAVVLGGDITVSGKGCGAGETVTVTVTQITSTKAVGDVIITTTTPADDNGEYSTTIVIPKDAEPGTYEVVAECGGVVVGRQTITVMAPTTPTTPTTAPGGSSTTPSGTIVRTGSDLNGLGLLGIGLLTTGGIILVATKSRRHQARA